MTLDEARRAFEAQFTVWPEIGDKAIAPTGERYVEVCSGGYKREGERTLALAASEEVAIELLVHAWGQYAKDKRGTLYWRILPEIDSQVYWRDGFLDYNPERATPKQLDQEREILFRNVFWKAYSRLLISDKPVIQSAQLESKPRRKSIQEVGYLKVAAVEE
jgi:hypothetical protein